ncbi:hypothetical protein SAMD00079811_79580 (plasmid) [Scytonema sp. HK-05]|uniref:hypothetical protein n=1 Tax=Scytonema sp. HK-05 TaxID=1137095 RepID=UPI00093743C1|nr:hypothetical protein NIES2130_28070 [Scytonema sp. HK-05]BAY50329.1 hypothetical protein SAMD00079811_79580 [Scytonema sp. HK-05]
MQVFVLFVARGFNTFDFLPYGFDFPLVGRSHLAPRRDDVFLILSAQPEVFVLLRKANKSDVTLLRCC